MLANQSNDVNTMFVQGIGGGDTGEAMEIERMTYEEGCVIEVRG